MANENIQFLKGASSAFSATSPAITNGNIYFVIDDDQYFGKIYLDHEGGRYLVGGGLQNINCNDDENYYLYFGNNSAFTNELMYNNDLMYNPNDKKLSVVESGYETAIYPGVIEMKEPYLESTLSYWGLTVKNASYLEGEDLNGDRFYPSFTSEVKGRYISLEQSVGNNEGLDGSANVKIQLKNLEHSSSLSKTSGPTTLQIIFD